MKAIPFITGYEMAQQLSKYSIFIEQWKAIDDGFEFNFSTTLPKSIIKIDINYLYFDESKFNDDDLKIDFYQETNWKKITPPILKGDKRSVLETIPGTDYCSFDDPFKCGIFFGICGFDLSNSVSDPDGLRVSMGYKINQSTKQMEISYSTWHWSQINGITSQYHFFRKLKCNLDPNSKNKINYKGRYIEKCPDGEFGGNDDQKNIIICKKCNIQCKTCDNAFDCLSCPTFQYLYKKQCSSTKPENTFCNKII